MKPHDVVIAWNGLPAYGAHLIQSGREAVGFTFPVLGTKPDVPIEGMEKILGQGLHWIEADKTHTWNELGLPVPKLFVHTGWRYLHFVSLADEVRRTGGTVVGMFDNSWKGNARQLAGILYFRLFLKKKFSAAWVPGQSGRKLASKLGFSPDSIREGMYGANEKIFWARHALAERPKRLLFIGRLIDRKGVRELLEAFAGLRGDFPAWTLRFIGEGPHADLIASQDGVELIPFSQPDVIARELNQAKILALPSHDEHWGLVVHEAALCGCGLLLSKAVGASHDLIGRHNGVVVPETSADSLQNALRQIFSYSKNDWDLCQAESVKLGQGFGAARWVQEFEALLEQHLDFNKSLCD